MATPDTPSLSTVSSDITRNNIYQSSVLASTSTAVIQPSVGLDSFYESPLIVPSFTKLESQSLPLSVIQDVHLSDIVGVNEAAAYLSISSISDAITEHLSETSVSDSNDAGVASVLPNVLSSDLETAILVPSSGNLTSPSRSQPSSDQTLYKPGSEQTIKPSSLSLSADVSSLISISDSEERGYSSSMSTIYPSLASSVLEPSTRGYTTADDSSITSDLYTETSVLPSQQLVAPIVLDASITVPSYTTVISSQPTSSLSSSSKATSAELSVSSSVFSTTRIVPSLTVTSSPSLPPSTPKISPTHVSSTGYLHPHSTRILVSPTTVNATGTGFTTNSPLPANDSESSVGFVLAITLPITLGLFFLFLILLLIFLLCRRRNKQKNSDHHASMWKTRVELPSWSRAPPEGIENGSVTTQIPLQEESSSIQEDDVFMENEAVKLSPAQLHRQNVSSFLLRKKGPDITPPQGLNHSPNTQQERLSETRDHDSGKGDSPVMSNRTLTSPPSDIDIYSDLNRDSSVQGEKSFKEEIELALDSILDAHKDDGLSPTETTHLSSTQSYPDKDTRIPTPTETPQIKYTVKQAYQAITEGQISVDQHDTIVFLEDGDPGWMKGRNLTNDEEGYFPSWCVLEEEEIEETQTCARENLVAENSALPMMDNSQLEVESPTPNHKRLSIGEREDLVGIVHRAMYPYQAQFQQDLSFEAGDTIIVLDVLDNGWWHGLKGEDSGWFPGSYVRMLQKELSQTDLYRHPTDYHKLSSDSFKRYTDRQNSQLSLVQNHVYEDEDVDMGQDSQEYNTNRMSDFSEQNQTGAGSQDDKRESQSSVYIKKKPSRRAPVPPVQAKLKSRPSRTQRPNRPAPPPPQNRDSKGDNSSQVDSISHTSSGSDKSDSMWNSGGDSHGRYGGDDSRAESESPTGMEISAGVKENLNDDYKNDNHADANPTCVPRKNVKPRVVKVPNKGLKLAADQRPPIRPPPPRPPRRRDSERLSDILNRPSVYVRGNSSEPKTLNNSDASNVSGYSKQDNADRGNSKNMNSKVPLYTRNNSVESPMKTRSLNVNKVQSMKDKTDSGVKYRKPLRKKSNSLKLSKADISAPIALAHTTATMSFDQSGELIQNGDINDLCHNGVNHGDAHLSDTVSDDISSPLEIQSDKSRDRSSISKPTLAPKPVIDPSLLQIRRTPSSDIDNDDANNRVGSESPPPLDEVSYSTADYLKSFDTAKGDDAPLAMSTFRPRNSHPRSPMSDLNSNNSNSYNNQQVRSVSSAIAMDNGSSERVLDLNADDAPPHKKKVAPPKPPRPRSITTSVTEEAETEMRPQKKKTTLRQAISSYRSRQEGELSFDEGSFIKEMYQVPERPGWFIGMLADGSVGQYHLDYVEDSLALRQSYA